MQNNYAKSFIFCLLIILSLFYVNIACASESGAKKYPWEDRDWDESQEDDNLKDYSSYKRELSNKPLDLDESNSANQ